MNKIRQNLFRSIDQVVRPIIEQLLPEFEAQAQQISDALLRLRNAVGVKDALDFKLPIDESLAESVSVDKISGMQLLTCDEMLEVSMLSNEGLSLKDVLTQAGIFQQVVDSLQQPNSYLSKISSKACYLSNVSAVELCGLVGAGDLQAVKNAKVSSYRVNQVVDSGVVSLPATHMGRYNAVHIAVAHRDLDIIKFFVEEKGAQLDIKAGRCSDLTVLDCAARPMRLMYPEINSEIVSYLEKNALEVKQSPEVRSYRDVVKHTFLKPPAEEDTNAVSIRGLEENAQNSSHLARTL